MSLPLDLMLHNKKNTPTDGNSTTSNFWVDLEFRQAMARILGLSVLCCSLRALVSAAPVFFESFEGSCEGRWIVSENDAYQGKWKYEKSQGYQDHGLLVSEKARKYAIAVDIAEPIDLNEKTFVLQYDLRLQNGLECGGAYLKFLLPQGAGWVPNQFDNESPYSIMFGPDKCGATDKVHFIFRHKNPKTGKYMEHHLKHPPKPIFDKVTHVYTAVIHLNSTLQILVDGEEKRSVHLLSADFEPSVLPQKTIRDPDDKKPEDWDERTKIPDPYARKSDDWDEDAPLEIEDTEAVKPEGWLDDEAEEIDDPESVRPEDWDNEEDGEWETPKVPNLKCDTAPGCGEWKRPTRRNPSYKGKWNPPMLDNPNYKGTWKPQQIPNPDYFELDHPNFEPIAAIGIEIWTMQDGILFDNILISTDEAEAAAVRLETWKVKFDLEREKDLEETAALGSQRSGGFKDKVFGALRNVADAPFLAPYKPAVTEMVEKAEGNVNVTIGFLLTILLIVLTIFYKLVCGGKRAVPSTPVEILKKTDMVTPDDSSPIVDKDEVVEGIEHENAGEIVKDGEEDSGIRHRQPHKEM